MEVLIQTLLSVGFLLLAFVSLTLPGFFLLRRFLKDLDNLEKITVCSVFGLVIFTLAAYFFASIHLRFLMWLFPILGIISIIKYHKDILSLRPIISNKFFFITVLIIGIIGMVAVNAPSGFPYKEGINFYSSHGHDGIWHIALMESMKLPFFPFQNPELAGAKLQNYHFFADLLMSEFSRLYFFSPLDIYFRFMPVIFALLLGFGSFIFVRAWSKSEVAGIWSMVFTYFAGSFGYLLYVPTHKSLGGESIFWVSQTQSVLGNPPHAAAFVIITVFLFLLFKYFTDRKLLYFLLCTILGGAIIEFKVYAGALILAGLFMVGIFELVFRRAYQTFLLFLTTFIVAFIIYYPNSANSQEFLIWQPWWFIRTMVVATDRLNWLDLELRRQTYIAEHNFKRVIQLETTAFLIFLFGNLGMRFLGFWTIIKLIRQNILKHYFNLFFIIITVVAFSVPVFFLQKGVAWNTIQFNQYFLLFFGFIAAVTVSQLLAVIKNKSGKQLVAVIIIILTVPTQLGLLWQFYSNPPLSKISYEELSALNYLRKESQQNSIILTAPFNKYEREKYKSPPIPIYAWYDTGYVSAFSVRQTMLSDEEQVNIMGYDVTKFLQDREEAFESKDFHKMNNLLTKYNIDYIYLVWDQKIATESSLLKADVVFKNKHATVFKVKR